MKKFSKLLAVLVALAVIICPMTSAIVANATANGGSYNIEAEDANNVVLTIGSNDGFIVYQATVTFNNDSAFQSSYSSEGYTKGLKVIDYSLVSGSKDSYNAPAISAQQNGSSLVILVSATDAATLDLYSEVQIGIRVASGSTANLTKIQAADEGTIEEDPSLLNFGAKVAADGTVDTNNNENATTGTTHEHNYTKTTPYEVSAPTCTAYGVYRKTCETCGAVDPSGTYTGTVMADHTPSNVQNATADFLASDATCTEPASYYYECTVCHAAIEEGMAGYTGTFTSGSALGHDMTMHSANAATCTTAGNSLYYSCDRCKKYFSDAAGNTEIAANSWNLAATGHTPVTIPAVAATCTTAGSTAGTKCSVCNEVLTAPTPIAALGHNMTTHAAVAATCTTAGNSAYYSCDRCNKFFSDAEGNTEIANGSWVIAATGHNMTAHAAVAATCTTAGNSAYWSCDRCNKYFSDSEGNTEIANGSWVIAATGHNMTAHAAVAATCTTAGNSAYWSCDRCNKYFSDFEGNTEIEADSWVISAAGHNMTHHAAVAATCTATGNTEYWSCDRCNKFFSDAEGETEIAENSWVIAATGVHTWGEYVSNNDATCTVDGTKTATCTVCGAKDTVTDTGSALGHDYTYTSNEDGTHDVGCTRCDFADTEDCDTAGTDGACSKCGYKASGSVLDASIVTLSPDIQIAETINIIFRASKATTTNNASYAHTNMVITAQRYDASGNIYTADPVVAEFYSLTSKNNGAAYYDVPLQSLDLTLTAYVACYNELGVEVAHSVDVVCTPVEKLKSLYTASPSTELQISTNKFVTDALNLGTAAQIYFGNQISGSCDLKSATYMNSGWDQTYATGSLTELTDVSNFVWNPDSAITSSTNNVTTAADLNGAPVIMFSIMKAASTGANPLDFSKLTMTVSYNTLAANDGNAGTITDTITGSAWNQYVVGKNLRYTFKKSAMYDSDKAVTAVITYDGVEVCTATYSLDSYVYTYRDNSSVGPILTAIARFTSAARNYFSVKLNKTV